MFLLRNDHFLCNGKAFCFHHIVGKVPHNNVVSAYGYIVADVNVANVRFFRLFILLARKNLLLSGNIFIKCTTFVAHFRKKCDIFGGVWLRSIAVNLDNSHEYVE